MVSAANGLLSNISKFNITLLDGPPPTYGALQQPIDSFIYTDLYICSSLWGCGPKDMHEKENREEKREYTHFSWHIQRYLKSMWFPLKLYWMSLLEGYFGRWHTKGTSHLKEVLLTFLAILVRIICAFWPMQFAKKYSKKKNIFNSLKASYRGLDYKYTCSCIFKLFPNAAAS